MKEAEESISTISDVSLRITESSLANSKALRTMEALIDSKLQYRPVPSEKAHVRMPKTRRKPSVLPPALSGEPFVAAHAVEDSADVAGIDRAVPVDVHRLLAVLGGVAHESIATHSPSAVGY